MRKEGKKEDKTLPLHEILPRQAICHDVKYITDNIMTRHYNVFTFISETTRELWLEAACSVKAYCYIHDDLIVLILVSSDVEV